MSLLGKVSVNVLYLMLWTSGFAQQSESAPPEEAIVQNVPKNALTRMTLKLDKVALHEALDVISEKGNLKLNYNRNRLPVGKKVSLDVKDEPALQAVLSLLKETGMGIRIIAGGHLAVVPAKKKAQGKISGRIIDEDTREPLVGVNVIVAGTTTGAASDKKGRFVISRLPAGVYSLLASMIGYEKKQLDNIVILEDTVLTVNFELKPEAIKLSQVIVTPGQFSIMGEGPTVQQTLTRDDLEITPFGEDIYRATSRLPGISAGDYSAKFTVRGGENDEILVLMDGMQLYEPFHLKDIEGGALSIIDVAAVQGIDLMTGGFPAEFGDRMSGVFNIKSTKASAGKQRTSLGLSFMNARIMSDGTFDNNKGAWLVSARRGYLDLILDIMGEQDPPRPVYYDVLTKVEYRINTKHTLSANILHAGDKLDYIEDDNDEDQTGYGNTSGWLTLKYLPSSRLYFRTVASFTNLSHDREGIGYDGDSGPVQFEVTDHKNVDIYGLKQDWNLEISEDMFLKWGFDLRKFRARYDYRSILNDIDWMRGVPQTVTSDTSRIDLNPSGEKFGAYLSNRFQVFSPLTAELGLRYDHNSFSGEDLLSPRLNMLLALGEQTFLRTGWGYFHQSNGVHEIRVQDGEDEFYPTELAKHWVVGLEHTFRNGFNFRLEGYYKKLSDLRPDYRNWSKTIEIFPEVQYDRYKLNLAGATSRGIEAYLKYDRGGKVTWWASYALASVKEDVTSLVYQGTEYPGGKKFPGRFDQRHTFYVDMNYRPNRKWHLNISWNFHTGWPYTERLERSRQLQDGSTQYYSTFGEFNAKRYPAYHRLDLTVNRHFHTSRGRISAFLTIINVYNHSNVRNIEHNWRWDETRGRPFLAKENENWFKLLPSIGISWSWDH